MTRALFRRAPAYGPAAITRNLACAALAGLLMTLGTPAMADTPAPPAAAHQGPIRIVAIGDSLTAGYGLPQGEGFVPQLQRWLSAHGATDVTIVDMGVSGDTTAGGLARIDWALADHPDGAIVELGGNDFLRGIDPATARANLAGILAKLDARHVPVLLAGMQSPLNWGPDYKTAFDAIYPDLAKKYGAILEPSFLAGLKGGPALFQADRIHPNAAGVGIVVDAIGPDVLDLVTRIRAAER